VTGAVKPPGNPSLPGIPHRLLRPKKSFNPAPFVGGAIAVVVVVIIAIVLKSAPNPAPNPGTPTQAVAPPTPVPSMDRGIRESCAVVFANGRPFAAAVVLSPSGELLTIQIPAGMDVTADFLGDDESKTYKCASERVLKFPDRALTLRDANTEGKANIPAAQLRAGDSRPEDTTLYAFWLNGGDGDILPFQSTDEVPQPRLDIPPEWAPVFNSAGALTGALFRTKAGGYRYSEFSAAFITQLERQI